MSVLTSEFTCQKWIKFFNSTCPESVAGRLVIETAAVNSTQVYSNFQEDSGVGDGMVMAIDE